MQSSKLPIEVCELVIDYLPMPELAPTDNPTESIGALYTCSLVCRDWVYRSQHHLFQHVALSTTRQAEAFLDVLTQSPRIAQATKYLLVWPLPPSSPLGSSCLPTHSSSPDNTLPQDPPLARIPPIPPTSVHSSTLPDPTPSDDSESDAEQTSSQPAGNIGGDTARSAPSVLSKFDIQLQSQTQNKTERKSIPPCYYDWIYKVLIRLPPLLVNLSHLEFIRLPTLHPSFIRLASAFKTTRTISLQLLSNQSFIEIVQLINLLPQLTAFRLIHCRWNQPARFCPRDRNLFEKLHVASSDVGKKDVVTWLGSLQNLSSLSVLELEAPFDSFDVVKLHHILQRCVHSLRYLHLTLDDDDPRFGEPCITPIGSLAEKFLFEEFLSLSSHSKLEHLRIMIPPSHFPHQFDAFSSCISQLISPSLVHLNIGVFKSPDLGSHMTLQSGWKNIDDALSDSKLTRLKYFLLTLQLSYEENLDRKALQDAFQTMLPKCYQRGILWVGRFRPSHGSHGECFLNVTCYLLRCGTAFHICREDEREFNLDRIEHSYS
ncbi:hypothetical protein NLI96_g8129 [Meripilus lineatus]|uniref:F-box domain-containing protein n=1 Tax=Meripilus lineatus TaxID=2056292 RepID=A0AAD5YCA9_9APHY|nr:hypothetical protein NLI96_g8129 [Physisporinus lineatus]